MRISIIGPFPLPHSGTTIKNHSIRNALSLIASNVEIIPTNRGKTRLILLICGLFIGPRRPVFLSVSKNGRKVLIPILALLKLLRGNKIALFPCGGTMDSELLKMPPLFRQLYVACCRLFDGIFPETKSLADQLEVIINAKNIAAAPNFKDRPAQPLAKPPFSRNLRVVYLGRLREMKGIFDLVEAAIYLKESGAKIELDFYGDFLPQDKSVEERFKDRIVDCDYIRNPGYLQPGDIIKTLSHYDVLVFPTCFDTEGFPGVLVDAAFSSLPVIASNIAYNSEVIIDGKNGLLCEAGNFQSIAEKLLVLHDDRALARKMGENNWLMSANYSSNSFTNKMLNFLQS